MTDWLDKMMARGVETLKPRKARKPDLSADPDAAIYGLPKRPKRKNPERDAQDAIVTFVRRHCRISARVAAVRNHTTPPAEIRNDDQKLARFFAKLKQGGLDPGHPDLTIRYAPARIEFWETKAPKGRLSDAQIRWHADARAMGFEVRVILDVNQAEARMRELGLIDNQRTTLRVAVPVQPL